MQNLVSLVDKPVQFLRPYSKFSFKGSYNIFSLIMWELFQLVRNQYRFVTNKWLIELYRSSYRGIALYKLYAQYERGCAVQARHIFSTREDVQYESDTSSVEVRMCITNQAHHQYK